MLSAVLKTPVGWRDINYPAAKFAFFGETEAAQRYLYDSFSHV